MLGVVGFTWGAWAGECGWLVALVCTAGLAVGVRKARVGKGEARVRQGWGKGRVVKTS